MSSSLLIVAFSSLSLNSSIGPVQEEAIAVNIPRRRVRLFRVFMVLFSFMMRFNGRVESDILREKEDLIRENIFVVSLSA